MAVLKAGSRLKSQVDDTQFVVVKAPAEDIDVCVGGHPVVDVKADADGSLSLETGGVHSTEGTLMGKRYVRGADDVEFLITKAGPGDLTIDGEVLVTKESKPLPSSD
jgi:hypothetical protein